MDDDAGKALAVVVAGPTCSGKSALALEIAKHIGGTIINADSMQVYAELRILTARPSLEEEAIVPHALYGVRPAAEAASVAWWRGAALAEMQRAKNANRIPILCGGTGLYFAALTHGLADIPDPGDDARQEARAMLRDLGPAALHGRLAEVDAETAARLRPTDSQRLARAWEVWRGTGKGMAAWQARQQAVTIPWQVRAIVLDPPRDALRAAIAGRFDAMLKAGALEEVRALLGLQLDTTLPAMRAHGVPECAALLRGEIDLAEAARRTRLVTGQYTKRQATWFRHRDIAAPGAAHRFLARWDGFAQSSERKMDEIISFICTRG